MFPTAQEATLTMWRHENPVRRGNTLQVKNVRTMLKFAVTGMVLGLLIDWLLSLVSRNMFVVLLIGSVGTLVASFLASSIGTIPERFPAR